MNIRWFSPLDADKTEIGRYSSALLPLIHEAFALQEVTDASTFSEQFQPESRVAGMAPINIYHIGNSHYHCDILKLAMREPGIVILHDVNLLELALAYARQNGEPDLAVMAGAEHGCDAFRALAGLYGGDQYEWCGQSQAQYDHFSRHYPLFETFIANATGVVVHSEYARNWVRKKYRGPLLRLDLPYSSAQGTAISRPTPPPFELMFCGHAGANRRLSQFFSAWGDVSRPDYFRLSLFGNIDKADQIMAAAAEAGVSDYIHVAGFVPEEALTEAISRSHLALNLRNPTVGEASASQLRYWSQGLPALVTDLGWYGELPDDVVIKISPEREHDDIVAALEALIAGEIDIGRMGQAGVDFLQRRHSPADYVQNLAGFVRDNAELRFVKSIFDHHLLPIMEGMCDDVGDSCMFEATLASLFGMVDGLESVQPD